VDLAEDLARGGRLVALKRIEGLLGAGDPDAAAERLRWFLHPRWAEVLDEGRLGDHGRFQVVRYVSGESVDRLSGPQPVDDVWTLLEDGARVLGAFHAAGLIHYDVTPGNFLREAGAAGVSFTLTDGGLAHAGPVKGIARGSPQYMAPELTEDGAHDHRVDLYSLGLVAFRLATGRDPLEGGAGEVLGRRRREPCPSARSIRRDLPESLDRVIASLLAREPAERPYDGAALLARIAEARGRAVEPLLLDEAIALATGGPVVGREGAIARFRRACRAIASPDVAAEASDALLSAASSGTVAALDPVILLHGAPGSGGTRVVREWAVVARHEDVPVLTMSGRDGSADRRGPLRRLADGLAALAAADEATIETVWLQSRAESGGRPSDDDGGRASERIVDLCERTAARTPFALLVEDFADLPPIAQEAVRVLSRHLLARAEHPDGRPALRIVLGVDHGPTEPADLLIPDAADPRRPLEPLAPLDDQGVKALLASRFAGLEASDADVASVRAASEGLPRIAIALLVEGHRRGDLRREAGRWHWVVDRIADYRVDRTLPPEAARALAGASRSVRALLEHLALVESPVPASLVRDLPGAPSQDEIAASPVLSVQPRGGANGYAIASKAVRDAVRREMSSATAAHRRAALIHALTEHGAADLAPDLARLHLDAGDAEGAAASLFAVHEPIAAALRARSLPVLAAAVARAPNILATPEARAAAASYLEPSPDAGALADAIAAAIPATPSPTDLDAGRRVADFYFAARSHAKCETVCTALSAVQPATARSQIQACALAVTFARSALAANINEKGTAGVLLAARTVRRLGPDLRRSASLQVASLYLAISHLRILASRPERAAGACRAALRRARGGHAPHLMAQAYNNLGIALQALSDPRGSERSMSRSLRLKRRIGDIRGSAGILHNLARLKQQAGLLMEAASLYVRAANLGSRHAHYETAALAMESLAEIYDRQRNPGLARATLQRALAICEANGFYQRAAYCVRRLAPLVAIAGDAQATRSLLGRSARAARASRSSHDHARHYVASATAALHAGEPDRAAGLATRALRKAGSQSQTDVLRAIEVIASGRLARTFASNSGSTARSARHSPAHRFSQLMAAVVRFGSTPGRVLPHYLLGVARQNTSEIDVFVSGEDRRLLTEALLEAVRLRGLSEATSVSVLMHVAAQAEALGLNLLLSRVLALRCQAGLKKGALASAGQDLSKALAAYESCAFFRSSLPRELRECLDVLRVRFDANGRASALQTPEHTELHALTHRLLVQGGAESQPDSRMQRALRMILNVSARLETGSGLEALLESLTRYALEITGAERACLVFLKPDSNLEIRVETSVRGGARPGDLRQLSHTIIRRVLASRTPLLLHDVFGDSELMARPSIASLSLRSILCVPMLRGSELYGVMYADSSAAAGSFDKTDLEILTLFAEQAAAAIGTSRLLADVQKSYTELKAMQERLLRGERLRVIGELTSGVAHEFNNLLTAILARIQLMELGYVAPDVRENLVLIEKAALDAAGVVRRLQGFARAQRQADFQLVDLSDVCGDVVELLRPLWASRRRHGKPTIAVRVRASKGLYVRGDATELREVITNLLKNALEALDRGGVITLTVDRKEGKIRLQVADDGPGIPRETLAKVFDPFFTTKGERGTGLGLCLCQQIVERHSGEIRLESEPPSGTTATVLLPEAAAQVREGSGSESPQRTETRSLAVLVVDDDPNILSPLCAYLERTGYRVSGAGTGVDALSAAASMNPDIVISDIAMPGMDGIEFCRRLKQRLPQIPVVLMSGQASAIEPTRVRDAGAAALLPKPFTMRQVTQMLETLAVTRARSQQ
jgi:signal transduction histidine kinase/DNA-binding response OmpR family regulator/tetratricopeptide (TPR) repeat protein